jgi:hypothetical protein
MDTWIRMEHEYGTVESMREARILIKRRTHQLNLQWQQVRYRYVYSYHTHKLQLTHTLTF